MRLVFGLLLCLNVVARAEEWDGAVTAVLQSKDPVRAWKELAAARPVEWARRIERLAELQKKWPSIVFTKHATLGGSHYAYTECQSDAQAERHWLPGSALCVLELKNGVMSERTLLEDKKGMIRDPDVSYDGKRILFSWKKSDREDDFHLYEMEVASEKIRQLTFGLGVADYEGAYLPNDDIVFNSTRCVQIVDCWWTEVSNLYTCDKDGKFLRRLTFDQVHDNYPTVLDDGRVIYTRWEYNDRGQIYPQPLYQMNYDGTNQSEFYGNSSWFPTTIMHARGIAGTGKVLAILSGHHSRQTGKLAIIDPSKGQQENSGVQLIAPLRETPAERVDAYGQKGELFQYPYPLSETQFLVTYCEKGWVKGEKPRFGVYWMNEKGERELLAADAVTSCNRPVPLAPRETPILRASVVDHSKQTGRYYMTDVYEGPGLAGVARGTIRKLRVVGLEFRVAGIGANGNSGPAGGALVSTPVAIKNGTWDVKVVHGDAKVYEDGSAFFEVPARTPVYFQALDEKNRVVQTMRSWSTVQPGETASCVGCHENKHSVPPVNTGRTLAATAGAQKLAPFYGPPRGFSFAREIQPILDAKCVSCHNLDEPRKKALARSDQKSFGLRGTGVLDAKAKRYWSEAYLALSAGVDVKKDNARGDDLVNWISTQSIPPMLPPYTAGSAKSALLPLLEKGHYSVVMSREELDKIACWIDLGVPFCGDYAEAAAWSEKEMEKHQRYLAKRRAMDEMERKSIEELKRR